jgi:hypothetical protein
MAGKDFEHQVQDRLDGWGIDPSDGVWGKLEASLERRKRRRRGFVVFVFAGLLLAGGMWYMMPGTTDAPMAGVQQDAGVQQQAAVNETPTTDSEMQAHGSDERAPGLAKPEESAVQQADARSGVSHSAGGVSTDIPVDANTQSIEESSGARASQPTVAQDNSISVKQRKLRVQPSTVPAPIVSETAIHKDVVEGNTVTGKALDNSTVAADRAIQASLEQVSAAGPLHKSLPVLPAEASAPLASTGIAAKVSPPPAFAPVLPETRNRERRIAFGLTVGAGRSAFTDGLLLTQEQAADAQPTGPTGSSGSVNPYRYSQDPATGFSAGAWMRMPMAARWTWSVGLGYQRWSTTTPVGQSLSGTGLVFNNGIADFTSSVGYTQGNQDTYRNDYHILQLPLDFSWQLNKGKRLPISWEMGLSPGVLLSSNALVRDSARALFSHPDNQRRFQLGMRTAFMFRLMPSSAHPLELGPVFQYQLNQVFTESVRDNGHLYYLGIEARMPVFFLARKQRGKQ